MAKELLEMLPRPVEMVVTHTRACGISCCSQKQNKRLNKEYVGLLLNVRTGKVDVLRAAFALPLGLTDQCAWRQGSSKSYQQWMRIKTGVPSENLICANLRPAGLCLRLQGRSD